MRKRTRKVLVLWTAMAMLAGIGLSQDAGVEFGAEDDLTVLGTEGTSTDADLEVKGYSVFGASGAGATTVTAGVGNVFISDSVEVASNLFIGGSADISGTVSASAFAGDGSQLTGVPTALGAGAVSNVHLAAGAVSSNKLDASVEARFVNTAGDTMTGSLGLPGAGLIFRSNDAFIRHLYGLELADDGHVHIMLDKNNNESDNYFSIGTDAASATNATELLRVNENGNVGIGTNAPSERLEVLGTVKASAFVGDGSGLTGIASNKWVDGAAGAIYYNGGRVGVGTASPERLIHLKSASGLAGMLRTDTTDSGGASGDSGIEYGRGGQVTWVNYVDDGDNSYRFVPNESRDDTNAVLAIQDTGDVGVGTTAPSAKMHIVGGDGAGDYAVKIYVGSDLAAWVKKK